jgi:superoxide dismutase
MWEHAYYLDYIGDRERYVAEIIMNLVNWEFADMRLNGFVPEEIR